MKTKVTVLFLALVVAAPMAMAETIVYVPLGGAGEILAIDAGADLTIGKISGLEEVHGLAGAPGGKYLVAGSYTETAPDAPAIPSRPKGVSEDEHRAHHAAPAARSPASRKAVSFVSVIQTGDQKVVRRIAVPGAVHHTAVTPDGRYAVATHPNDGGVSVIDLAAFKVVKTVRTGPLPNYAVVSSDGKSIYVSNAGNGTISEIDTSRWTVRRDIAAGSNPEHLVLSPEGDTLYVNNVDVGKVSVISLARGEVVRAYEIGGVLHGIDLSDDGATLFVSAKENNRLVAIDLEKGRMRGVPLAPAPYHLTAVRGTGKLYISSAEESKIWVVDQQNLGVQTEIPIRGMGHQMVVVNRQ
jgi:YVTN family beta-propeller protein